MATKLKLKVGDAVRLKSNCGVSFGIEPVATVVALQETSEGECEGGLLVTLRVTPRRPRPYDKSLSVAWVDEVVSS